MSACKNICYESAAVFIEKDPSYTETKKLIEEATEKLMTTLNTEQKEVLSKLADLHLLESAIIQTTTIEYVKNNCK